MVGTLDGEGIGHALIDHVVGLLADWRDAFNLGVFVFRTIFSRQFCNIRRNAAQHLAENGTLVVLAVYRDDLHGFGFPSCALHARGIGRSTGGGASVDLSGREREEALSAHHDAKFFVFWHIGERDVGLADARSDTDGGTFAV